jgi:hypothetical protein
MTSQGRVSQDALLGIILQSLGMVPYAVTGGKIFVADRTATCAPMSTFGGKLSAKLAVLATDGLFSCPIDPQITPFSITD